MTESKRDGFLAGGALSKYILDVEKYGCLFTRPLHVDDTIPQLLFSSALGFGRRDFRPARWTMCHQLRVEVIQVI